MTQAPAPAAPSAAATPSAPVPPPLMAPWRMALYALASVTIGLTQGLGNALLTVNLQALESTFSATPTEASYLSAAYFATSSTASLLLFKFRTQFGLRLFAQLGLALLFGVNVACLFANDLHSALILRGILGFAAAPLSTLAFFYMLEIMPPAKKLTAGVALGLLGSQLATPLARLISPTLLDIGLWGNLYSFEVGLAAMSLAFVFLLPLTHPPRARMFDWVDMVSFPLLALGFGLLAIALSVGRLYWWLDAPWIGACLAGSIAALTLVLAIELNRTNPILDLRWISSSSMLLFAGSLLVFRIVLSEQTTGAVGFLQMVGLLNEQMATMFWIVLAATAAGYLLVSVILTPARIGAIHLVALALIAAGAWMDGHATSQSRPVDLYLSQSMIAFGGSLFLPSALSAGFGVAVARGPRYILSFIAIFVATQNMGGLIGSAGFGTFITVREKVHSHDLLQSVTLADPLVVQRIQQYGASYGRVLTDPVLRAAEGSALLAQQATREANTLAYNDVFFLISGVAVLAFLGLVIHMVAKAITARRAPPTPVQAA